jgi:hypothetical protein
MLCALNSKSIIKIILPDCNVKKLLAYPAFFKAIALFYCQ